MKLSKTTLKLSQRILHQDGTNPDKDYLEQKASEVFAKKIKDGVWMEKDSLS